MQKNNFYLFNKTHYFFLYGYFKKGALLTVVNSQHLFVYFLFNTLAVYAKAAAHGALGDTANARRYIHVLRFIFPFTFLKRRLAKYLGLTQPELVRELLGPIAPNNSLRIAFELVSGAYPTSLRLGSYQPSELYAVLWHNRLAVSAESRISSVNQLLEKYDANPVQWAPLKVTPIVFMSTGVKRAAKPGGSIISRPLVSVLVTAYNSGSYVSQALKTLLSQTYVNIQILVASDASTDDTWAHISSLVEQDSRITAFNLPENIGTYAAKALMFRFAKGEYIVCHDADDLAAPNFIERSFGVLLSNPRKVAVISNWFRVDEELRIFPGAVRRFWPLLSINHSSLMLRTEILKNLGAWDVPRVAADTELFERIRVVYGKRAVVHLPEPLTIGSMRADSLMNDPILGAMEKEAFRKRVEYREAWVEWHQVCKRKRVKPIMSSPLSDDRPFYVPEVFRVDPKAISRCWDSMLSQHSEKLTTD